MHLHVHGVSPFALCMATLSCTFVYRYHTCVHTHTHKPSRRYMYITDNHCNFLPPLFDIEQEASYPHVTWFADSTKRIEMNSV
eukprot:m.203600 g.203600  ORF g.203600 m.203600 type:complete len:83 (+) comp14992_c0_seq23:2220-2468(+)